MARERDEDSGKYTREYEDEEFLKAVETHEMPSTAQVAEVVGCSYTLSYHRLNKLQSEGKVQRITVGNSFAWTTP